MTSLSNKSVIVIGAGSGVGRATALLFASVRTKVFAVGRQRDRLEPVQKEAGAGVEVRALDATDARAVDTLIGEVQPDLIVLCAGARAKLAPVHEHSWETFSEPWQQDVKMAFEIGQPGSLEGRAVLGMYAPRHAEQPNNFVFVEWRGDRIVLIRDFRHVPYIADEIALERAVFSPDSS